MVLTGVAPCNLILFYYSSFRLFDWGEGNLGLSLVYDFSFCFDQHFQIWLQKAI
jgi:hypothetical protein